MSRFEDGKQVPNPGISKDDCMEMIGAACTRKHREDAPHVSFDEYQDWLNGPYRPGSHDDRHLRMGQAFCNHFNVHDDGLFYETAPIVCSHAIWTYYVDSPYYDAQYSEDGLLL
jgi:hypothetical protein